MLEKCLEIKVMIISYDLSTKYYVIDLIILHAWPIIGSSITVPIIGSLYALLIILSVEGNPKIFDIFLDNPPTLPL